MSAPFDPPQFDTRLTLARADLADAALEGLIVARRFAPTRAHRCTAPAAALRQAADSGAEQLDQLLYGEAFDVLTAGDGWAWGQARRDGYVGFVRLADLAEGAACPSHRVCALRAYAFAAPDIKSAPVGLYSLNALVQIEAQEGRFGRAAGGGWFVLSQLSPIGQFETDPAAVAERFVGAPYQWGGRESLGLDCSGLVQQALYACGRACPRDSDQQARLGREVGPEDLARGDLVAWRGHVGLMLDGQRLVHANALHMAVTVEPLAEVVARGAAPTAMRRL